MNFETRNPATGELIESFPVLSDASLDQALSRANEAAQLWKGSSFAKRSELIRSLATVMQESRQELADTITLEMGKLSAEALAEVDKCISACEYFAENAESMLSSEVIETHASRSHVVYEPLGVILAIMPWNFPMWQVLRCLIPTIMAGNGLVLKHSPNVPRCAKTIEELLVKAGAPDGLVIDLKITTDQTAEVIADARVKAIAFTGSENAGKQIAAQAGKHLKKVVLEMGGSDPFIVLDDANMEQAVEMAVRSRFANAGQVCIAAKRFIVVEDKLEEFTEALKQKVQALKCGAPDSTDTTLAPIARGDLRDQIDQQVQESVAQGATLLTGGTKVDSEGYYYSPTILTDVKPGMTAFDEEIFGPVASIISARDEQDAIEKANATRFGLGASVWTEDKVRGEVVLCKLEVGCGFVNSPVFSDVRMPFGGVKASGIGRELGVHGIREFTNCKSVWVA